jgi:hypothetical protein
VIEGESSSAYTLLDSTVLDAAVNGQAEVIATFNRRDFLPGTQLFPLAVLAPAQTLRRL